jgi:hypothetical protein
MTLFAAIGKAQGLDAVEAAVQATDQALAQTGRHHISLAVIAASHDYPFHQVVNGVSGLLSDTPLFGLSTPAPLTAEGVHHRSIVVALLVGDQIEAECALWSDTEKSGRIEQLQSINISHPDTKALLVVAEGLQSDADTLINSIPGGNFSLAGCLAGGDIAGEKTYIIGGGSFGSKGMAGAALRGEFNIGMGSNHGWQPIGIYTHISHASDLRVHTLDGRQACEAYAGIFGYPARDWIYPPLNQLVRLYPLGFEIKGDHQLSSTPFQIRSPIRVEPDGSLRMNSNLPQGKTAHFLVSSIEKCTHAAKAAAQTALETLGEAKPVLALIFADIAWQMLFQAQPGMDVSAVREVIGEDIPIIGGYTFGQVGLSRDGCPELLNQHIQVILIGDPA